MKNKKIICDLDNTITIHNSSSEYQNKLPNLAVIQQLRKYKLKNYSITIFTARNMRTFDSDLAKITLHTLPIIERWLNLHNVPYDEIIIGKPWCADGFYVDDKAIRPSEFINLEEHEILDLVK